MNARSAAPLVLAASIGAGCTPALPWPAVSMASAGDPGGPDDPRAIVEVPYTPGDLPAVPRMHRPHLHAAALRALMPPEMPGDVAPPAPTTKLVLQGARLGHDPAVAAGDRFLMVYTAHRYELHDKATGAILAPEPDDEVPVVSDFSTLFSPLWAPRDKRGAPNEANINRRLRFAPGDRVPCNPEDPLGKESRACMREFYDSRVLWDPTHKRFWIESAVRNHLWFCTPSPTEPCTDPKWSATQPRRFIAIAVSRTEDPRKGWHRYILVDEYADWPKMAIHDRYLVLGHMQSPFVYVFDADRLAAGNPDHGPVRLARIDARTLPGGRFLDPVTHHGPTGDVTFLVGTDGSDRITVYGLLNPDPSRAAPPIVLTGPRLTLGERLGTFENNAVYRDGELYLTWDACAPGRPWPCARRIRILRLPATRVPGQAAIFASTDPRLGFLDTTFGGREPGEDPSDVYDYVKPVLDVTGAGDIVIGYARRGFRTRAPAPFDLRYSVLHHDEQTPRPGVLVRRGTWAEAPDIDDNSKAGIDLAGAQTDPDDRTVWISHAVSDGPTRWFRQVTVAVQP